MKKSKVKELSEKSVVELGKLMGSLKIDISRLTLEKNAKRLKDVSLIGKKRKEIAQILTFIRLKEKV